MRWLILLIFVQFGWSQVRHPINIRADFRKVLAEAEQIYDIRYSFADDSLPDQTVELQGSFSISEFHEELSRIVPVSFVQIDERYFAIVVVKTEDVVRLDDVEISTFISKGIRRQHQGFLVQPDKVKELPGVPDADLLLSLQQMPGVRSPNETATGLHVRGGTPDQNLILWDGIRIFHQGHLFGMISGFNPNIRQSVKFQNKGTDSRYGERISSVIEINPRNDVPDSLYVTAGANGMAIDAFADIPVNKKLSIQASARRSFVDQIKTPTFDAFASKVFQNTSFRDFDDNKFFYQDYTMKVNYKPSDSNGFSVTGIFIDNGLDYHDTPGEDQRTQQMAVSDAGLAATWNRKYSDRWSHFWRLHYSKYRFSYERDEEVADVFRGFDKRNRVVESGFEAEWTYKMSDEIQADFGYQLLGDDVSHELLGRSEGIIIGLDQRNLFSVTHSGYGNVRYNGLGWTINGGLRYGYYRTQLASTWEPRLFVRRTIAKRLSAQASFERKSQILSQARENIISDMSLENYVWVLSDGNQYPLIRAWQVTTGLTYRTRHWLADVDFYVKNSDGHSTFSYGISHESTPANHQGEIDTKGADVLLQWSDDAWRIWATYSYQYSLARYSNVNNNEEFAPGSDIRHSVTLSAFREWKRIFVSAGIFWHTGRPYSKLLDDGIAINTNRLPDYYRVDVSAGCQFSKGKGRAGLSILNIFDRKVLINREYQQYYGTVGDLQSPQWRDNKYYSLGFTPNVFVRYTFR